VSRVGRMEHGGRVEGWPDLDRELPCLEGAVLKGHVNGECGNDDNRRPGKIGGGVRYIINE
jgi:hypothetical protein